MASQGPAARAEAVLRTDERRPGRGAPRPALTPQEPVGIPEHHRVGARGRQALRRARLHPRLAQGQDRQLSVEGSAAHLRVAAPHAGRRHQDIRDLLGHTSTRMTERYAHLAPGKLHDAIQRLNRSTEVAPGVAPAPEEARRAVTAGAENPEASRDDESDGRYWDRTSGPRLVRAMLSR